MKRCKRCKRLKRKSSFYWANTAKTVLAANCKKCANEVTKHWRSHQSPEKRHEIQIKWKYGLTLADKTKLLEAQNNGCAICGNKKRRLQIDHCHISNKVRGLLCRKCNCGLGMFNENVDLLSAAIAYLTKII